MKSSNQKNTESPYQTRYSHVRNHLDYFLGKALDDIYAPLTMEEIKERLREIIDVNINVKTLKKDLPKFAKKYGENLLC